MIEINTAILCASISTLKPLLTPRRLRKAMYDGRARARFTLVSDVTESRTLPNEYGNSSKITADQDTSKFAQMVYDDPTSPATELGEYGVRIKSPAPALVRQEVLLGERYSKISWRSFRF